MTQLLQRTLKSSVSCVGTGLHSGVPVEVTLRPAPPDAGIIFVRTDLSPAVEISARAENVIDAHFATSLGLDGVRIGTVEHLLSALVGLGIDNARIELDGAELPIMDGSAAPFVYLLRSAGLELQRRPKRFMVVRRPIEVHDGDRFCQILPAPQLSLNCTIDFDHPLLRDQEVHFTLSDRTYDREVARARTFAFRRDVESLQRAGLAKGGSLANAIVIDDFNILNPEGLRYADEFVRHKVLDLLGDLALCGMPVLGHVVAYKSGHALHHRLARALCAGGDAVEVVEAREERQFQIKLGLLTGFGMPGHA
jgi:UDP-3-O-[3-hydroxymyristoyl] N-acetylglucosamine deacetylase